MTLYKAYRLLNQISNINTRLLNRSYVRSLYKDIGKEIKKWRRIRNLSLREASIQLGISKTSINDAELGRKNPLGVISQILGYVW